MEVNKWMNDMVDIVQNLSEICMFCLYIFMKSSIILWLLIVGTNTHEEIKLKFKICLISLFLRNFLAFSVINQSKINNILGLCEKL